MNYSELLQLAKGWGNFKFYRGIIWRLRKAELQMGKTIRETMQEFTVNQALKYLEGNPEENIPKLDRKSVV